MILLVVLLLWLLEAVIFSASGQLQRLRPPGPQLILVGLTTGILLLWWRNRRVRASVDQLDLPALVGLHLTRFVGLYFLYLCGKAELPREFAVPAGWGDTAIAVGAAISLLFWSSFGRDRRWLMIWNTLGLIDIVFVVATAARLGMANPGAMAALLRLPLSLLPTFLVPLIIASHIVIFGLLRRRETGRRS